MVYGQDNILQVSPEQLDSWTGQLSHDMTRQFFASILISHYSDVVLVSIKALSALHTELHIAKSSRAKSSGEEVKRRGEERGRVCQCWSERDMAGFFFDKMLTLTLMVTNVTRPRRTLD